MRALFDLTSAYEPTDDERRAPVPAVGAVLFDFSNTLFHMVDVRTWLTRVAAAAGRDLDVERTLADVAIAAADPEVVAAQHGRDLSDAAHRAAMRTWFARVPGLAGAGDTAVDVLRAPDAWVPYPDTVEVLDALAARGVPVGIVSDIAGTSARTPRPRGSPTGWGPGCSPVSSASRSPTRRCSPPRARRSGSTRARR